MAMAIPPVTGPAHPDGSPEAITTSPLPTSLPSPLDIAADRCKGCGLCVDVCPHHVLELDPIVVNPLGYHPARLIDPAGCTSCVLCARVCPDAIFTVYTRPKGGAA